MSDIAIRLDGLILAACLAFGISTFLAIAVIIAVIGFVKRHDASRIFEDARKPLLFAVMSAVMFGALVLVIDDVPTWIDWLSLAYLPVFIGGWIVILRPAR